MRAGGVAVRSESLAGMSWGSPPLFSAGDGARLNFGGGRAASKVGERGAAGWLLQLLQGRGGGSGQTFFPVSFRREEPPVGGGRGKERCRAGCRKPEKGFVCVRVLRRLSAREACG